MKSSIVATVGRLVLLLAALLGTALLLKGHDEPGGGFVAGLAFAIAAVLALMRSEGGWEGGARRAESVAVAGGLLILATLAVPALLGQPALTHAHGVLELPPGREWALRWKWHTALIFDLGVVLAVAGGAAAAARVLWRKP